MILFFASTSQSCGQLIGPTPYLGFDDRSFQDIRFDYFQLEDFEDNLLEVPGVIFTTDAPKIFLSTCSFS